MEASAISGENSTKVFIEAAKILHSDYLLNGSRSNSTSQKSNISNINKINPTNNRHDDKYAAREHHSSCGSDRSCEIL